MLKKVRMFVVRGSEDGNLGIYSSVKKAYERAVLYMQDCGELESSEGNTPSLAEAKSVFFGEKGWWYEISEKNGSVTCEIQAFRLDG